MICTFVHSTKLRVPDYVGQMVRKRAQAGFGNELVSIPCVRQSRKKNESIKQESVIVKCTVQVVIDTHCITRKLIISVNKHNELSPNYHAKQNGLSVRILVSVT